MLDQLKIEFYNSTSSYSQCNEQVEATNETIKNETPYSLTFGFEVIILLEVDLPVIQTEAYDIGHNEGVLAQDLDLSEERRENTLIRMADYQKQLAKTYNQKVQHKEFLVGDIVLRKVVENTKDPSNGSLARIGNLTRYLNFPAKALTTSKIPRENRPRGLGIPTT